MNYTFKECASFLEYILFMPFFFMYCNWLLIFRSSYNGVVLPVSLQISVKHQSHSRKGLHFDDRKAYIKILYVLSSIQIISPKDGCKAKFELLCPPLCGENHTRGFKLVSSQAICHHCKHCCLLCVFPLPVLCSFAICQSSLIAIQFILLVTHFSFR